MLKNHFSVFGISSKQSVQSHSFHRRIALSFITISLSVISHAAYLLCLADDFTEYTESIYMFSVSLLTAVFKVTKLFTFFDGLEKHVNESE